MTASNDRTPVLTSLDQLINRGPASEEFTHTVQLGWEVHMYKAVRCWLGAAGLGLLLAGGAAAVQEVVRVRGTIERVEGDVYVITARDGSTLRLTLAANATVAASVKSALSDIKPGAYIGVAGLPLADGSQRALEVHIFHESMRGTGEGHRPWDLQPRSTMTNATVEEIAATTDGHSITLTFKDGEKRVIVPSGTVIVTYLPGSVSELRPGAVIFVPAAARQPDGTVQAQRVMVGRDVAPPQ